LPLHDAAGSQILPQSNAAGSQIFPLHYAVVNHVSRCIMQQKIETKIVGQILPLHGAAGGSHDSPLHNAAGSQILPLHDAAGSQISPTHDAAGSRYWQRGVKSKKFWRLTNTLKEQ
jgi:hypothetical protein